MCSRAILALALTTVVIACGDDGPASSTESDGTDTDATDAGTASATDSNGTDSASGSTSGSGTGSTSGGTGPVECPGPDDTFEAPLECPCDPYAPNCEDGLKCNPVATAGQNVWNANQCLPLDPSPVGVGQPCSTPDGPSGGIDNCDVGLFCWDVDDTNTGVCVETCGGTEDAPTCSQAGEACSVSNGGVLNLCLPQCDPIAQDCAAGQGCYPEPNGFFCTDHAGGGGAYGEVCEFLNVCEPGSWCADATAVPGCMGAIGCCTPMCDVTAANTCPDLAMGQTCVPFFEAGMAPAGYEDVGFCSL